MGRTRSCSKDGSVEPNEFNRGLDGPVNIDFTSSAVADSDFSAGDDSEFIMSNPVCLSVAASTYATTKSSIAAMNSKCGTGSAVPRIVPTPWMDAKDLVRGGVKGASNASQGKYECMAAFSIAMTSWSATLAALKVIYEVADDTYQNTKVCGSDWIIVNPSTYSFSTNGYKKAVQDEVDKFIREGDDASLSLNYSTGSKFYREWYYGGVEVEDNPASGDACYDVTQKVNGAYPKQRYYMQGLAAGNFNCKKYDLLPGDKDPLDGSDLTTARMAELRRAYDCCKSRSAQYICIDYAREDKPVFCRAGEFCRMNGSNNSMTHDITFEAVSVDNGRFICAQSYSLCPYNFTIGAGSEYCNYYQDGKWNETTNKWEMILPDDIEGGNCASKSEIRNTDCTYNAKAGKCRNYCQYLTHCTTTSNQDYHYESSVGSPYFSDACINFVGDSQNKTSYGANTRLDGDSAIVLNSQRHFSAPIVQCVRETMENLFHNVAGHSRCRNNNEYPSANGACPTGNYAMIPGTGEGGVESGEYKKGNKASPTSFFTMLQDNIRVVVKMTLTLSVMFFGMSILIGKTNVREKKTLIIYILKIALVLYFATGDAWQKTFFKGVYAASSEVSRMVFKMNADQQELKRDGCQFGEVIINGTPVMLGKYPPGKSYLAIWDTLDCKLMRYLGYGPQATASNIGSLILAGIFTPGAVGIYFAVAAMSFGLFFLAATMRALHIFLSSSMAIIIMVFVSPVIIPLALFERTKSIFDSWVKELLGFCLQPVILFAYIAFFINIMDKAFIGSATFSGEAPYKTISCSKICKNSDGTIEPYVGNKLPDCMDEGQRIVNPMDDSVACLINLNDFGTLPGLEWIGLPIPILMNIFNENTGIKILTLLKAAVVMFVLYKMMDEASGMAARLMGGSALPGSTFDASSALKAIKNNLVTAQKRAAGAAGKMGKGAMDGAKAAAAEFGDKGKQGGGDNEEGSDSTESSGGGGDSGGPEGEASSSDDSKQ